VKTGTVTATPAPKTAATTSPAASSATIKAGTQAPSVKTPNGVQPAKTAAIAPATKKIPAAPNAKKVAATKATPKATATKKVAAPKPAKPAKTGVVAKTVPAPPLEKKGPTKLMGAAGRRDPFISPIRAVSSGSPTGNCTTGKRCLAIPELILQGTVRDISGKMMAIVITSNHRTYTLRENDQVFNGSVEKITSDSIIFREFVRDAVGRESAKEVVKKLSPTS
jgi:hypothetical protein